MSSLPCRRQAKEQAGENRDARGESEYARVWRQVERNVEEFDEQAGAPHRDQDTQSSAEKREQEAFGQHLANQSATSRTGRHTNRDLPLSDRSPR